MKFFIHRGKKYILEEVTERNGITKLNLKPFNEKEYEKTVKFIADKLKHAINTEDVIKAALENLEWKAILQFKKSIQHKAKVRKRNGCLEIKVGKSSLCIVN